MDERKKAKRWHREPVLCKTMAILFLELTRQRLASTGRLHLSLRLSFTAGPVRLAWTACLRQLGCGGTSLNHGLGKPPRLRVLAIGSMRLAASWSWASSEARLPQGPRGRVTRLRLAGPRGRHQISSVPV